MDPLTAFFVGSAATATTATGATVAALTPAAGAAAAGAAGSLALTAPTVGLLGSGGVFGVTSGSLFASFGIGEAFSVFSGLSAISGAQSAAEGLEQQAKGLLIQSKSDELQGRLDALRIVEDLNETIGADIAQKFASGVKGSGSVAAAQEAAIEKGEFELEIARSSGEISAASRRSAAEALKFEADAEISAGVATAVRGVGLTLAKSKARG